MHRSLFTLFTSLLATLLLCSPAALAQTAVPPAAGDGLTTDTAYQITELGNLVWLGEQAISNQTAGKYYRLMNDIDASVTATWNDAGTTTDTLEGFVPIGGEYTSFLGAFDGGGHKIVGLTSNRGPVSGHPTSTSESVGLFGSAGGTACVIRNLGLQGGSFLGRTVGTLVGDMQGGTVTGCWASGTVTGVGYLMTYRPVWLNSAAGGLVGANDAGDIRNSYATGAVNGNYAGGLVGLSMFGSITNCYATGVSVGTTGTTGKSIAGGLLGEKDPESGPIISCYWDTETSGRNSSAGGTSETTALMKQQSTFLGWDFTTVWAIAPEVNQGYPYLRAVGPPLDPPSKPVAPSPADGATSQALAVTLRWQDGGGATSYDVYLGTANPPVTRVATSQTETSYSPPSSLGYGTTYFWRIDAKNAAGTTAGDVWRFTTAPPPTTHGDFLGRRVKSSHSEKWDGKGTRIVAKDAYSFSAKMQLPVDSLASISNATTLTLVLGDAVTSGAACEVFERPLSDAMKSTLEGHLSAKNPKNPTRGGSVTFVELQPNSKKKARVVTIKWTKTGLLTVTVVGAPALANWDPADPAQRREVENIADLCDGAEWPEGAAAGVAVPTLVDLSGVFIGAETVACGGKKSVKSSDGGDLIGWSVSGKK